MCEYIHASIVMDVAGIVWIFHAVVSPESTLFLLLYGLYTACTWVYVFVLPSIYYPSLPSLSGLSFRVMSIPPKIWASKCSNIILMYPLNVLSIMWGDKVLEASMGLIVTALKRLHSLKWWARQSLYISIFHGLQGHIIMLFSNCFTYRLARLLWLLHPEKVMKQ